MPENKDKTIKKPNVKEFGGSGTEIYSGFFSEEYLTELLNMDAADVYDKMRRSDTQIALALSAVNNAILAGRWSIEHVQCKDISETEKEELKKQADFISEIIFERLDKPWIKKLKEILTCIAFGHSAFEVIHELVKNDELYGDYIGLKKLGFRSQKTIYKWNFDKTSKEFKGITQMANGDLSEKSLIDIPSENLMVFSLDDEGDNLEGISMLRQCYGPWKRKNLYMKLMAIGIEKSAIGTPIGKYPVGEYNTSEYTRFRNSLKYLTSHNRNYLMLPQTAEGDTWSVDVLNVDFKADKIQNAIDYEDMSIVRRFIAQFLMLGSSSSGSWALSTDQSDFFLNGLVFIADMIAQEFDKIIKDLVDMNFGKQKYYPYMAHSRIKDKSGKELAEVLNLLIGSGSITTDDKLEDHVRVLYDLPEKEISEDEMEDDKEEIEEIKKEEKLSEITLAEKSVRKQIDDGAKEISKAYNVELKAIADDLVEQVVKNYENATTEIQQVNAARNIQPRGVSKYRKALGSVLKDLNQNTISDVENNFKQELTEFKLKEIGKKGKKKSEKYTSAQTDALVETQISDVKNAIVLQFPNSISEDNSAVIRQDLTAKSNKKIKQIDANSITVSASIINKTREFVFFDEEVIQEIESFTFINPNPKAQICIDLRGQTFLSTDARALEYTPPLHYNCNTFLRPNLRVKKNNPAPTEGGIENAITKAGRKSKNLSESCCEV